MLIALWIVNGLLAFAFLGAGLMKSLRPAPALQASGMAWVEDFSAPTVKAIGVIEIIGALGLVLPLLTGIAPVLAPLAAVGLVITMLAAAIVHVRRGEQAAPSLVLGVLSLVSAALGFLVVLG